MARGNKYMRSQFDSTAELNDYMQELRAIASANPFKESDKMEVGLADAAYGEMLRQMPMILQNTRNMEAMKAEQAARAEMVSRSQMVEKVRALEQADKDAVDGYFAKSAFVVSINDATKKALYDKAREAKPLYADVVVVSHNGVRFMRDSKTGVGMVDAGESGGE